MVHTTSLLLLSNMDIISVWICQQPHRPCLRRLVSFFFFFLLLSFSHLFTRLFICLFIYFGPMSVVSGLQGTQPLLHQRQQQDQPAITVITVCAYIGLLCFVPHLPSSAGSLSSNLPVITNSRRGNRRNKAIREEKAGMWIKRGGRWPNCRLEFCVLL